MENLTDVEIEGLKNWLGSGSINIFGMPFSGKDTHGQELARFFNGELIGGGDLIRNSTGIEHVKRIIAAGNLAPIDEYLALVLPYLSSEDLKGRPLILSSVGRWKGEEVAIIEAAEKSGHEIKAVLCLSVTKEESYRRWQLAERGREDDIDEEILSNRFNEFESKTLPVIDHYRDIGLLVEVDAMSPKKEVTTEIFDKLLELSKKS